MTNTCVACRGLLLPSGSLEGYIEGETYQIAACQTCGTKEALPHVAGGAVYDLIYKHRRVAPGYARYAQFADTVREVFSPLSYLSREEDMYYGVAKMLPPATKETKVLDVGCGLGYLTFALNKAGYYATGVDISEEAIANAKKAYGDFFICGDFFALEESYDVICMLELIEHVENPEAFIIKAKSLLKKGGKLIITTPNQSWFPVEDLWNTDLPPVHITWFSEKGIIYLLSRNGFQAELFNYTWYNFMRGTILSPRPASGVRTPIFSQQGVLLTTPYKKSSLRKAVERLKLYGVLKGLTRFIRKVREGGSALLDPSRLSLRRGGTICVSATF